MEFRVGHSIRLLLSFAAIFIAGATIAPPVSNAAKCPIPIEGTEKGPNKACIGDLKKLLKLTTEKIVLRTEMGETLDRPSESDAINELVGAAERLLNLKAPMFAIAPPDSNAAKCTIPIEGTEKGPNKACIGDLKKLFRLTTAKIALRTEMGKAVTEDVREEIKKLVNAALRLLILKALIFAKDRILHHVAGLEGLLTTYRKSILIKDHRTDLDDKLKKLSRTMFTWIAGSKTGSISKFAEGFNYILTHNSYENEVDHVFEVGLPNQIKTLIRKILDASEANQTAALIVFSAKLARFVKLGRLDKKIKIQNDILFNLLFGTEQRTIDGETNTIGLVPGLLLLERERYALAAERRAISLKTLLDEAMEKAKNSQVLTDKARRYRKELDTIDIANQLNALRNVIDQLIDVREPKIHIIRAWFGHLGQRWSAGSQCSATSAMRARCERKPNCSADDTAGQAINATSLCGFDPAPVARGRARGLVVRYSCERGGAEFWEELANSPRVNPMTGSEYTRANSINTVLRSTTMKLSCSFAAE